MKVLFLSVQPEDSGSAYALRLNFLRASLEDCGVQTDFLSLREQRFNRPYLAHPLNVPSISKKVADYDFIHAGGDAAYTAAFLKPFTRAKIVYDVHDDTWFGAQLKWLANPGPYSAYLLFQAWVINVISYPPGDFFLVVSKPLHRRLVDDKHVSPDRIGLIRNGVDLEMFTPVPPASTGDFTVCYAGSFKAWQGIEMLVSAFEQLPSDCQARLKMVGFTDGDAALKADISRRLGGRVELVDRVSQTELATHLTSASALVSPRIPHRGTEVMFPSKFAEYLALGKPVIVCDIDEGAQMIARHNCGFVSEPTPESLSEAIYQAATMPGEELSEIGRNARLLAEREFSWSDIGKKYAELLARWIEV